MQKTSLFYLFMLVVTSVIAQKIKVNDSLNREAIIKYEINGNTVNFIPETPALTQIAGAPKAFYTHFWEFGDGNYSRDVTPSHNYTKEGTYEVRLWATNNYDTGKPPTTRPKKVVIDKVTSSAKETASMETDFDLIRNREPIPNEEIVAVLRYKNTKNYPTKGKIYLFYNEQKYKTANFELTDTRTYHGEKPIEENLFVQTGLFNDTDRFLASADAFIEKRLQLQDTTEKTDLLLTLEEAKSYYSNWNVLEFDKMQPNEERNIFYTLKTTPEMLKDTSAIISVRGVYVPDDNYDNHKVKDMEMEIVTSHDPNKMSSNGTFINYRFVRSRTLKYKIRFQNNGEGPARTIRLETDIPEMLDKSTLHVIDMYPKCEICPEKEVTYSCLDTTLTKDQVIFTFKNIYLPGSEQKNVKVYDSTKGYVKYKIKFSKDFHKKKTKSRTAIIFDKNEPIITNYSTTRFLPGISVGIKTGYNSFSELNNSESYFIGATLSPYKSYRFYWQVELLNSFHRYDEKTQVEERLVDGAQGFRFLERNTTNRSYENTDWEIPVLLRYNVNNYIGLGVGVQGTLSLNEKQKESVFTEQFEGISPDAPVFNTQESFTSASSSFTNLRTGFLVEATAGFARIGPSLGARYVINFKRDFNYLQLYAIWKF